MKLTKTVIGMGLLSLSLSAFAYSNVDCSDGQCGAMQVAMNDYGAGYNSHNGLPSKRAATGNRVFVFSPTKMVWAAYDEQGQLVRHGEASGGKRWCGDVGRGCRTPVGTFKVYRKGGADCVSSKYPLGRGGAPMAYCMFFSGGSAIHASPVVPEYNSSHGCIRVHHEDARWLHQEFIRHGTTVQVLPYRG
ncbi:MAG: L,D-transpeptidase [Legionellales bacterium]|nr:L,D-transpeptidase [Legionellales bacterium]